MGFLPNDFKSNHELSGIFGDFLDQHFYKPMESLIVEEDPPRGERLLRTCL